MPDLTQYLAFILTSIILCFTPGPDIIYVMTRGIAQGKSAALAAAAGFSLGNIGHTLAAVLGISALLMSSATAFQVVKLAGAAYLIYLGFKMFRAGSLSEINAGKNRLQAKVIFRQSLIANMLNPKVAIFFLAFLPQFVSVDKGHAGLQMLVLGLTFVILTFICFGLVGLGSGHIGNWLNSKPAASKRITQGAGCVLAGLGLKLAWGEQ